MIKLHILPQQEQFRYHISCDTKQVSASYQNLLTSRRQKLSGLIHCSHLVFFIEQRGEMFPRRLELTVDICITTGICLLFITGRATVNLVNMGHCPHSQNSLPHFSPPVHCNLLHHTSHIVYRQWRIWREIEQSEHYHNNATISILTNLNLTIIMFTLCVLSISMQLFYIQFKWKHWSAKHSALN